MSNTQQLRQKLNDLKQNRWSTIALALILLWFLVASPAWLVWNYLFAYFGHVKTVTIGEISGIIAAIALVDCLLFGGKRK